MPPPAPAPFRHLPPELRPDTVRRERLLDVLEQRFDRRLVVVVAGAGFGKTTLLAQAVAENRSRPAGCDVWLVVNSRDRQPAHLIEGLSSSLLGDPDAARDVDALIDSVWARAPEPVCFVLDDAHVLDGSPAWEVVGDLLARLPANAHLLVGSRRTPPLPLRLLQARGDAVVLGEDELAFDRDELAELVSRASLTVPAGEELPGWPALAVLMGTVGMHASLEFLWEAVLDAIEPERREALGLVVRFERLDDELLHAAVGDQWALSQLVAGLPLIDASGAEVRFHDLWQAALAGAAAPVAWKAALARGADVMLQRGEVSRAVLTLRSAGHIERMVEVIRRFASSSISAGLSATQAEVLYDALPAGRREGSLGRYLLALRHGTFENGRIAHDMKEVHTAALSEGDDEMRALALWRLVQYEGDVDPGTLEVTSELSDLAEAGWPLARSAVALVSSHQAQYRRDVEGALAVLDGFEALDPITRRASVASRLLSLGHPERVAVTLDEVLADGVSDPVAAQAVWWRGDIDPSVAWPIAAELPALYDVRRLAQVQVPLLGVLTSVALAAGDIAGARALADDAGRRASVVLERVALFADVADALVVLATDGDDAAVACFERCLRRIPLEPWPAWAYIAALAPLRALMPGTEWLDDVAVGPSVGVALAAGRACRELRDTGDVSQVEALPWDRPHLLRVHVPPSMLFELALSCADHDPSAAACLEQIPEAGRWLPRLADHRVPAVRSRAAAEAPQTARRPTYEIVVTTFGQFGLRRSDGAPIVERGRGGRVLQLLAQLLVTGEIDRRQLAERMWPDGGEKQALVNLRTTLAALLDTLEPDREPQTSWFVRADGRRLRLADEGVRVDVHAFERHLDEARSAEVRNLPSVALQHYLEALPLYQGEFLPGIDDDVIAAERVRLLTLAYSAGCRAAELLLARGEPEQAMRSAIRAQQIDPLGERAQRTEIRCHVALGATTSARTRARALRQLLRAERLTPDRETELLLAQVDS